MQVMLTKIFHEDSAMRFLPILAVVLLSGCSYFSKQANEFACPKVGLIPDANILSLPNAEAEIGNWTGTCSFKNDAVIVDLNLPFKVQMKEGTAATKEISLPYFIAALSEDEQVLQRQAFSTEVSIKNTEKDSRAAASGSDTEEHSIRIPVPSAADAYKYKVVIGFSKKVRPAEHMN